MPSPAEYREQALFDQRQSVKSERDELRAEIERLRAALRQILNDPEALILNSHRDDGWAALGEPTAAARDIED